MQNISNIQLAAEYERRRADIVQSIDQVSEHRPARRQPERLRPRVVAPLFRFVSAIVR